MFVIVNTEQSGHDAILLGAMSFKPFANFPPSTSSCVTRAIGRRARDQCPTVRYSFDSVGRWLA
eukprot:408461-Pyramimonas_sp.AAC.1